MAPSLKAPLKRIILSIFIGIDHKVELGFDEIDSSLFDLAIGLSRIVPFGLRYPSSGEDELKE